MSELMTRITTLIDAEAPPIDIEELVQGLEATTETAGTSPVRRQRRSTNWAVAVGAAIVVFVLIGGFAWLIGGTEPDVVEEPMPMVTVETTLPPPTTTVPAVPSGLAPETAARADGIAFDFAEHDLCDWFTPDEIREFVADAHRAEGSTFPIPTALEARRNTWARNVGCDWDEAGTPKTNPDEVGWFHVVVAVETPDETGDEAARYVPPRSDYDDGVADLMLDGVVFLGAWPTVHIAGTDRTLSIGHTPASMSPDDNRWWMNSIERQRIQIRVANAMLNGMNWVDSPDAPSANQLSSLNETIARERGTPFNAFLHSLCDWFAPDEIRDIIAEAYRAEGLGYPIPTQLVADPDSDTSLELGCHWGAVGAAESLSLVTFGVSVTDWSEDRAEPDEAGTDASDDLTVRDLMRDGIIFLGPSEIPNIYVVDRDQPLFIGHIPAGEPDVTEDTFDQHVGRWLDSTERQRVQIRIMNAILEHMNWLPDTDI